MIKTNTIYLGKFHHDLTILPKPGIMVKGKLSPNGRTIQVSEVLLFAHIYIYVYAYVYVYVYVYIPLVWLLSSIE